jgi:hypothetical protein
MRVKKSRLLCAKNGSFRFLSRHRSLQARIRSPEASVSACTPVCRVHAAYQLPLVASLKLDELSEICFSSLNYSGFFPLPPPETRREYDDSQGCLESRTEDPEL